MVFQPPFFKRWNFDMVFQPPFFKRWTYYTICKQIVVSGAGACPHPSTLPHQTPGVILAFSITAKA